MRRGIDQQERFSVIPESRTSAHICADILCAVEEGKAADADMVMYGGISMLGAAFGQMYPTAGYDDIGRAFVLDSRVSFQYPQHLFNLLGGWRFGPMGQYRGLLFAG